MKLKQDTAIYQQEISRVEPNLAQETIEINNEELVNEEQSY